MQTIVKEHSTQAEKQFKQVAGTFVNEYIIDEYNEGHVAMLLSYFTKDASFEEEFAGNYLNKGIMLVGNVGSGKTLLMNIFRRFIFLKYNKTFCFKNLGTFSAEYKQDADKVIFACMRKDYLFDELGLGTENINNYGNKINIVEELVRERYEDFIAKGTITHFTTNLLIEQIQEIYGERTASRLTEMCNFIELTSHDRRQDAIPKKRQAPIQAEPVIPQPEQEYQQACFSIISHVERVRQAGNWLKFGLIDIMSGIYYEFLDKNGIVKFSTEQKIETLKKACQTLVLYPDISDSLAHKTDWFRFKDAVENNLELPKNNFFSEKMISKSKKELFKTFVMDVVENNKDIYKILNIQKPKKQ